jgi:hypothetical protein
MRRDRDATTGRRHAERVLDEVRDDLERPLRVADRRRSAVHVEHEVDAERARLRLVAADRVASHGSKIDGLALDVELDPVQARQLEHVLDEPLEPTGFRGDRLARLLRVDDALVERLGVPADRGERRAQLVGHREQEAPFRGARPLELRRPSR